MIVTIVVNIPYKTSFIASKYLIIILQIFNHSRLINVFVLFRCRKHPIGASFYKPGHADCEICDSTACSSLSGKLWKKSNPVRSSSSSMVSDCSITLYGVG